MALQGAIRLSTKGISGPARVIHRECVAGRDWDVVVSPDGVQAEVTRFRLDRRNG